MEDCEPYRDLPMIVGKSKVNTFKGLQEKITKKGMGWKEKFISKVGREILIKTVAQATLTYTMVIFKIPNALCDTLNSTLAKYWWVKQKMKRKFIRSIGKSSAPQKQEERWGFETYKHST